MGRTVAGCPRARSHPRPYRPHRLRGAAPPRPRGPGFGPMSMDAFVCVKCRTRRRGSARSSSDRSSDSCAVMYLCGRAPYTEAQRGRHLRGWCDPGRAWGSLRFILTPGHTPGSAALHVPTLGALFVGDAFATYAVTTGARGPQVAPFTAPLEQACSFAASLPAALRRPRPARTRRSVDRRHPGGDPTRPRASRRRARLADLVLARSLAIRSIPLGLAWGVPFERDLPFLPGCDVRRRGSYGRRRCDESSPVLRECADPCGFVDTEARVVIGAPPSPRPRARRTRTWGANPWRRRCSARRRWIAIAQSSAAPASPNEAKNPSPVVRTTVPPW